MDSVRTLYFMIKSLLNRSMGSKQYRVKPYFYGLIIGDGSYTCKYHDNVIGIKTSRIGTLLAFIVSALNLNIPINLYTFPRHDNISFSKWKIRCYVKIHDIKQDLCSKTKLDIAKMFSSSPEQWFSFNAGLMDSDGAVVISIKKRNRPKPRLYLEPEIIIMDQDKIFLEYIRNTWENTAFQAMYTNTPTTHIGLE
jgi:hypothetical protein